MAQYYLAINGQQLGPFEVNQLPANGLTPDSYVWTNGMPNWMRAAEVPELAPLFAAPAPPPAYQAPYQAPAYQAPAYQAQAYQAQARGPIVDKQKVDMFIMTNKDNFPAEKLPLIQERLSQLDESTFNSVTMLSYKNPMTALLLSIFCGSLGVDRFFIGDTGMGIGKLLTAGGCGIWAIIDWFMIQNATREKNYNQLSMYI